MNIGFTNEGKLPNAAVRAIIDFGNRSMEAKCPGLTYCGISRGTTIGKVGESLGIPPKSLDSAIYFRAGTFPENIQDLTISLNTMEEYKKVTARKNWVEYLKTRESNITYTEKEAERIINWMNSNTIEVNDMIQYIRNYPNQKVLIPETILLTQKQETQITNTKPMDHSLMDRYFKIFIKKYVKYLYMDSNTANNLREYGNYYWKQMINAQKSNSIKNIHKGLLNSKEKLLLFHGLLQLNLKHNGHY